MALALRSLRNTYLAIENGQGNGGITYEVRIWSYFLSACRPALRASRLLYRERQDMNAAKHGPHESALANLDWIAAATVAVVLLMCGAYRMVPGVTGTYHDDRPACDGLSRRQNESLSRRVFRHIGRLLDNMKAFKVHPHRMRRIR